ncbi:MAG: tetratricopeptide repeat protein [Gemmatimonadota bacterium]
MKRIAGLTTALTLGLALAPLAAHAQAPRDNSYTRAAEQQVVLAVTKSTPEARLEAYQMGLDAALEGLRENPSHAKLWLLAGQAHVGLGNFAEGLEAYKEAVRLYPEYEEEVAEHREAGWIAAFNAAAAHLEAQELEDARADLMAAHGFYQGRPEAMAYLGAVNAQLGNIGEAEEYYRQTLAFLDSPAAAEADEETRAEWQQYRQMAEGTLGQLEAAGAVEAYQAGDYDTAIKGFRDLLAANPYDRDVKFMIFTGLYEKARALAAENTEAAPEEQARILDPVFEEIVEVGEELAEVDPANSSIMQILAQVRTARARYQLTEEAQQALNHAAIAILTEREAMPFFVDEVAVEQTEAGSATVQGGIIGNTALVGSPVKIRMILIGQGGTQVGTKEIEVAAPAPEEGIGFQEAIQVSGPVLGWKYVIIE